MRRRDLIAGLLLTTAAQPAVAQQSTTTHRVAIFHPAIPAARIPEDNFWQPFLADLRGLNDIGGENLLVERYSAEGHHERYADLAKEIVHSNPDVIVTVSIAAVIALTAETKTIPVVASMLEDPLKAGLVTSLARPGSNLTGVSLDAGVEIWGKRLQLLKEAVPSASTVAFLGARQSWEGAAGHVLRGAGARLGISLIPMLLQEGTPSEIERVFALMGQERPDAVLVSGEGDQYAHRQLIVDLAEKYRLAAMYAIGDYAERGGLIAYVADLAELRRRLVDDVRQILKGAKAGDIPIYQAARFAFIVNLKTANALGLTIPPGLVARADQIIE